MTIHKQYVVNVPVPQAVWDEFSGSLAYDFQTTAATKGATSAGSEFYDDPYEWAIFDSLSDAKTCEKKLIKVIKKLEIKLATVA